MSDRIAEARERFESSASEEGFEPTDEYWHSWLDCHGYDLLETAHEFYSVSDPSENAAQKMVGTIDRFLYRPPIIETTAFGYAMEEYDRRLRELRAMPYPEFLRTPEWQRTKRIVRARFNNRCAACNSTESLHVHHRTYAHRGEEDIGDLTLLCADCHNLFHTNRKLTR